MKQEPDQHLTALRAIILDRQIPILKETVERGRESETNRQALAAATAERERLQREQAELESLTPVQLVSRGLSAEQAADLATTAKSNADAAAAREKSLSERVSKWDEDVKGLFRFLHELNYNATLLSEGEFLFDLSRSIDFSEAHVPELTEQSGDHLFRKTRVYPVYANRSLNAQNGERRNRPSSEALKLAEEILAEPILDLKATAGALPHSNGCRVTATIAQRIRESA
ncbi:MAG TPA: hypothetical protein VGG02_13850 [Chthoniobacterales bacterium]|jgi:hypothetical protein